MDQIVALEKHSYARALGALVLDLVDRRRKPKLKGLPIVHVF